MSQRPMNPDLTLQETSSSATEQCPRCDGHRFVTRGDVLDGSIKLYPCPECNVQVRDDRDWFAPLRAQHMARGNQAALAAAEAMAKAPAGWLVLHGPIGTGKTALAKAIESTIWGKERFPRTVATILGEWQSHVTEEDFQARFERDCSQQVMVLDNLGRERLTPWKLERLGECLDWRYARHLATVITTEYDVDQLAHKLGDRPGDGDAIADRIFSTDTELVVVVTLKGPSFRTGKVWK
jgi:DNA replication protein DnaC